MFKIIRRGLETLILASALTLGCSPKEEAREVRLENVALTDFPKETTPSEANQYVANFPEKIPGAAKIKKYNTPGAKYCLVHVRQIHQVEGMSEDRKRDVKVVQEDIYNILDYLVKNAGLNEAYVEAIPNGGEELQKLKTNVTKTSTDLEDVNYELEASGIRMAENELKFLEYERDNCDFEVWVYGEKKAEEMSKKRENRIKELKEKTIPQKIKERTEYEQSIRLSKKKREIDADAIDRLHLEGRIDVKAAETFEGNVRADISCTKYKSNVNSVTEAEFDSVVLEDRENILLGLVSGNNDTYAVCVYGGAHNWHNNIKDWNKQYPDNKFSLIEVTPESYEKYQSN